MKELLETILNEKTARNKEKLMDVVTSENTFSTWD